MEKRLPQHRMGILAIGRNDFSGNVYRNECPACGVPPFFWCQTETAARLGTPHLERSIAPMRAQQESGVDRTGLRIPKFGDKRE